MCFHTIIHIYIISFFQKTLSVFIFKHLSHIYLRSGRTWQRHFMYFPGGDRYWMFVRSITTPNGLYERRRWLPSAYHMLLPLLLLHFQGETAAKNALQIYVCIKKHMNNICALIVGLHTYIHTCSWICTYVWMLVCRF